MTTPSFTITPVKRRKLSEEVSDRLQELMLNSELKPGDELPSERELMEMFGVGRTSVREAFVSLSQMGLVELRNGERARVTKPSATTVVDGLGGPVRHFLSEPHGVEELQRARVMFEVMLARHAANYAQDGDKEALRDALEANRQALGDVDRFTKTDLAFHLVLAESAHNSIFPALHSALITWLAQQRTVSLRAAGADQAAFAAHEAIYAAVAAGTPDAAEAAMTNHLHEVEHFYQEATGDGAPKT